MRVPPALWFAPAVALMAGIFLLSSGPVPGAAEPALAVPGLDKLLHIAEYFVLGVLLLLGIHRGAPALPHSRMLAVAVGVVYAISDEVHQALVPGRRGDFLDLAADATGVLLGVLLVAALLRRPARIEEAGADGGED